MEIQVQAEIVTWSYEFKTITIFSQTNSLVIGQTILKYCYSFAGLIHRELELKNAWLSVDGLKPMAMLTSLTVEFIRLDDEGLNRTNDCFPSLQVLNLISVGGL